jgi:hypothetical protein
MRRVIGGLYPFGYDLLKKDTRLLTETILRKVIRWYFLQIRKYQPQPSECHKAGS